jgi:xyloglucan-specific endo-beta-1,4-glucanase
MWEADMKRGLGWFCSPRRAKETKLQVTIAFLFLASSFLSACESEIPTLELPIPTPSPTSEYRPIIMNCDDWAMINIGDYQARNNTWGKGDITDWHQCVGLGSDSDGTIMGRWVWDWPESDTVVAFPSILFGHVPPTQPTTEIIPIELTHIDSATVSYEITSQHTGMGNVALDIWLTDTQFPSEWTVPPLTHEIMIWLDTYGGMYPAGSLIDQVRIDGIPYNVYVADNFGLGWRYIAFASETSLLGSRSLDLVSFFSYLRQHDLLTGEEYLAAIELGNEIAGPSVGQTWVNRYIVTVE